MDFFQRERKKNNPLSKSSTKQNIIFKEIAMTTQEQLKNIVENLIEKIESDDTGAWIKPFGNSFPANFATKFSYSGLNTFNLWGIAEEKNYSSNYWMTYKQIKILGGSVKKDEKALAKAQNRLSKTEKGTKIRRKKGKVVAKIHERIRNRRRDFCHQESRKIIDQYQYICVEDLNIRKMIEGSSLAKSISDASWKQFQQFLTYKAEEAGRKLGLVNPAYTTQTCHQCKNIEAKKLSEREHRCSKCGYKVSRDFNAAQNILALGLDGLGAIPRSPPIYGRE